MANKPVTITDVAVSAGVSVSTASKALCGKGRMGEDTRSRIVAIAKNLGYKPNRAAQALSRRTVTVAALLSKSPVEVQRILRKGLADAFEQYASFNVNFCLYEYEEDSGEHGLIGKLSEIQGKADILIMQCGDMLSERSIKLLEANNLPVVTLVSGATQLSNAVTSVVVNAETVGKVAAQFLSMTGASHTVIFAGRPGIYIHERNIFGFRGAAEQYGLTLEGVYYTEDKWDKAYACAKQAFGAHPEIDGIFISSYLAPSVCNYLKEQGLADKVKVIGVDLYQDIVDCLNDGSLNATIYQNQYLQARTAVDIAMDCISVGYRILPPVRIKPELVISSNLDCYLIE